MLSQDRSLLVWIKKNMKFNFSYEPGLMEFVLSTFEITTTMLVRAISYDLEMKTREQNRNNKQTEI